MKKYQANLNDIYDGILELSNYEFNLIVLVRENILQTILLWKFKQFFDSKGDFSSQHDQLGTQQTSS